jgi:hypothetical protein
MARPQCDTPPYLQIFYITKVKNFFWKKKKKPSPFLRLEKEKKSQFFCFSTSKNLPQKTLTM